MNEKQRVLVLGASGYIGQNLIPELIKQGYQVTAAARRVDWMLSQGWQDTQCVYVDLQDPETLKDVMKEIDIVYFLVHSMADHANLIERERTAARHVQQALDQSNVKHVIYLSSLQHGHSYSQHLISRRLTGRFYVRVRCQSQRSAQQSSLAQDRRLLRSCVIWFTTSLS